MESTCPHLGADMSHAEIEEIEENVVAVCPWHRYDFDLRTGKSETGLRACTYVVETRASEDGQDVVWVEEPEGGKNWRVVELRPVSEGTARRLDSNSLRLTVILLEFADPPPLPKTPSSLPATAPSSLIDEPITPVIDPPTTLMQWAVLILSTANPLLKVERTRRAVHLFRTGQLSSIGHKSSGSPKPPDVPPREDSFTKNTVSPTQVKNRKNRAVMLHALANIEQWA